VVEIYYYWFLEKIEKIENYLKKEEVVVGGDRK
jgi:hypothetical protein